MTPSVLVQYGRLAHLGRFRAAGDFTRGDAVLVRTPRGVELGQVMLATTDDTAELAGEVVRPVTDADHAQAATQQTLAAALLADAEGSAATLNLPLSVLDCEPLFDGLSMVLHVLPWDGCDADGWLADLAARHAVAVRLLDVAALPTAIDPTPTPAKKCGDGGCGTGGGCTSCGTGEKGGCSTGSCSRGEAKSAPELTRYFAGLREQMEKQGRGRVAVH